MQWQNLYSFPLLKLLKITKTPTISQYIRVLLCDTNNSSSDKPNVFIYIPEDQKNAVIMQHCIQKTTFFSLLISNEQTYYW